jgi:hypothetical protein
VKRKCSHRPNRIDVVFFAGTSTTTTRDGTKSYEYHLQWCPTCGAIRTLKSELDAQFPWTRKPSSQWRRPGRGVEGGIPVLRALNPQRVKR